MIMPPIGLMLGGVDFSDLFLTLSAGAVPGPYATLAAAKEAGAVTINYGLFANALLSFVIVAFSVFMVVRSFNQAEAQGRGRSRCPAGAVHRGEAARRDQGPAEGPRVGGATSRPQPESTR